jgi:hypothetical protein
MDLDQSNIAYNVYDGTGDRIYRFNRNFRSMIRSVHQYYKAAPMYVKKKIAVEVYQHIEQNGGHFYNADQTIKSKDRAILKIQQALKDMRGESCQNTSTDTASLATACERHLIQASTQETTEAIEVDESINKFCVYDGTGGHVAKLNCYFLSLLRSRHVFYKQAPDIKTKKQIAKDVYDFIISHGGVFYNNDGTTKSKVSALQKVRKSLHDMCERDYSHGRQPWQLAKRSSVHPRQDIGLPHHWSHCLPDLCMEQSLMMEPFDDIVSHCDSDESSLSIHGFSWDDDTDGGLDATACFTAGVANGVDPLPLELPASIDPSSAER